MEFHGFVDSIDPLVVPEDMVLEQPHTALPKYSARMSFLKLLQWRDQGGIAHRPLLRWSVPRRPRQCQQQLQSDPA